MFAYFLGNRNTRGSSVSVCWVINTVNITAVIRDYPGDFDRGLSILSSYTEQKQFCRGYCNVKYNNQSSQCNWLNLANSINRGYCGSRYWKCRNGGILPSHDCFYSI
ncbi:uncharacterized protein CTRU02_204196 [Colletotrichum truncatum]|uniref:Uncharacterized protein n=1 Tax=Colletotrichum truncatum TaxID=5467 RepID=A0ACC3ZBZ2_COLTU|nr:uncharacterized protein CTRU02_10049 [Colletotrichum truncatum]KAF6787754.1 hypothetical protein CTRU02_10049 [Colletotrichum truncatum]